MKHLIKYHALICLILIFSNSLPVIAQSPFSPEWSIDGDIRYRLESWKNINALYYGSSPAVGSSSDRILLQRAIAGTRVRINKNLLVSAHIQDSRAFGWSLNQRNEPDAFKIHPSGTLQPSYIMNPQEEFLEIYDAYVRIDNYFNLFTLVAGRQKIAFGDNRVFGPGTWGNTGRWNWDALKLSIDRPTWEGSVWIGGTKIHDPQKTYLPFTNSEYHGGGVYLRFDPFSWISSDLYYGHQQQGSADFIREKEINRNWLGFRIYGPSNLAWKYDVSLTRQFGKEELELLNGTGFFAMAGYQSGTMPWKPRLTFRYTFATGDNPLTEQNELFLPAYGAGDKYYGWMNLMKWSNLDDREIMLELFPVNRMSIELKYNRFRIPQPEELVLYGNLFLPSGRNHLGDEINLFATFDLNEKLQFTAVAGYFIMQEGRTAESDNPGNAVMVSLQFLYRFNYTLTSP